jgi:hypothetical protein
MTLRNFIDGMQAGWGFARPHTPKRIGAALATLFEGSPDLDAQITVEYHKQHSGYGPNSSTSYIWDVSGVTIPQFLWLVEKESETDRIFGRGGGSPPAIFPTPEGLRVIA